MANFYLDNKDLQYHLGHPLMKRIIELKERNFADAKDERGDTVDPYYLNKSLPSLTTLNSVCNT